MLFIFRSIIALVVAASLFLSGLGKIPEGETAAATVSFQHEAAQEHKNVRFEDMVYVRPDMSALSAAEQELNKALSSQADAETVKALLDSFFEKYYSFYSMNTLARIRSFANMEDSYYARETEFCQQSFAQAEQLLERVYIDCAQSIYAEALERDYFWDGFAKDYGGEFTGHYSDEAVRLSGEIAKLLAEYYELVEAPAVVIDGEEQNLNSFLLYADDEEYYNALLEYYRQYSPRFGEIFLGLVRLRTALAKELGFDSVWDMTARDYGRDFSWEQAGEYLDNIVRDIVPLYKEYMLSGKSAGTVFTDEERSLSALEQAAKSMGSVTGEAYNHMKSLGLHDIGQRDTKAPISFTAYLYDYETPYLFIDSSNGDGLLNLFHEFGHFTQMYDSFNADLNLELSECFSQGMEFLGILNVSDALTDTEKETLTRGRMEECLADYIQQGMFAEFERLVYSADPELLDVEALKNISLICAGKFGLTQFCDEDYCSMLWMDIAHFYEFPFYVISYCISNDTALSLYSLEKEEPGRGVECYNALLRGEYGDLVETLEAAGLKSPFAPGRTQDTAKLLKKILPE